MKSPQVYETMNKELEFALTREKKRADTFCEALELKQSELDEAKMYALAIEGLK